MDFQTAVKKDVMSESSTVVLRVHSMAVMMVEVLVSSMAEW
jgi:hypothetical protein